MQIHLFGGNAPESIAFGSGGGTARNTGVSTVYYADNLNVDTVTYDGTIAVGNTVSLTGTWYFVVPRTSWKTDLEVQINAPTSGSSTTISGAAFEIKDAVTASYDIVVGDDGKLQPGNSGSHLDFRLASGMGAGRNWQFQMTCDGAGGIDLLEDSAVTVNPPDLRHIDQHESLILTCRDADIYQVERGPDDSLKASAPSTLTSTLTVSGVLSLQAPYIEIGAVREYYGVELPLATVIAALTDAPIGSQYRTFYFDGRPSTVTYVVTS